MNYDVVIVLGFDVREDGSLPEEGRSRVRAAATLLKGQRGKNLLLSGRVAHVHKYQPAKTEAEAMADYAMAIGIPDKNITLEDKSRSTYENALFTKEIAKANNWTKIAVVTSQFHAQRAEYLFQKVYGESYQINFVIADNCLSPDELNEINRLEEIKWTATLDHDRSNTLHLVDKAILSRISIPST